MSWVKGSGRRQYGPGASKDRERGKGEGAPVSLVFFADVVNLHHYS